MKMMDKLPTGIHVQGSVVAKMYNTLGGVLLDIDQYKNELKYIDAITSPDYTSTCNVAIAVLGQTQFSIRATLYVLGELHREIVEVGDENNSQI